MPKAARSAFEVKLTDRERDDLADELATAILDADAARSASLQDVAHWHRLYEQARTRSNHAPWQDAADLTSYLGTQYVDAYRARIVDTVFVEPVYTVEGWGEAAQRAPFVEEFHQWQIEEEGFQQAFSKAAHLSLIEPRGVLEVYEDTIRRPIRKKIRAKLKLNPLDGTALVDADMQPLFERTPEGKYVEAQSEEESQAELEIDSYETLSRGPRYRTIAYRDYLALPGHARDKSEIWGHAKRFTRRVEELQERAEAGQYDKQAVADLGEGNDVSSATTLAGDAIGVPEQREQKSEKELWEILFLKDLDGKGLRWFVATLDVTYRILLRLQYDDIGRPRYFSLTPFPRPNSTEGYSLIGHKLITSIEGHTAWRNMGADRQALELQVPIKRLTNALWDPDEQPLGARAVIDVRDMNEIQPMELPRTGIQAMDWIVAEERGAEKIIGMTDLAAGVTPQEDRTLGETKLVTEQSFIRIKEVIKNIQEELEGIAQVRHLLWQRALEDMGEEGLEAPPSVTQALTMRGVMGGPPGAPTAPMPPMGAGAGMPAPMPSPMGMGMPPPPPANAQPQVAQGLEARSPDVTASLPNFRYTAQMLRGAFRFKPRGSVETADKSRQRQDLNQLLQVLAQFGMVNPLVRMVLSMPKAAKAVLEEVTRLYTFRDKEALIGGDVMAQAVQALQMQAMAQQQQMQQQQQAAQSQQQGEQADRTHSQSMDKAKLQGEQQDRQAAAQGRQFDQSIQAQQAAQGLIGGA